MEPLSKPTWNLTWVESELALHRRPVLVLSGRIGTRSWRLLLSSVRRSFFPCTVYWFKWKQVANPNKHHVKESSKQTEISAQHDTMGQENHRGTGARSLTGGPQRSGGVYVCVDTCIHSYVHERTYEWPIMCGLVSLFKTFIWSISAITVIAAPALHHKQFF